ncbi:MAG: EamA family transporter [Bacteroidetes bacterium]|nr:EamA family transporter [Bacteroidota bacterium]
MKTRAWLFYAAITTVLWGVWGALIELPEKSGFPATLGYAAWAVTMIPVSAIALRLIHWKLDTDRRSVLLGMGAGLLGCGGQLILFQCLRIGPAYIVFPLISLYPVVTILLSVLFLREKGTRRSWAGIVLALVAIFLLAYQPPGQNSTSGMLWVILSMLVFVMWGVQAFIMKLGSDSNRQESMQAESVTFYLMASAVVLVPVALLMTDFSSPVNWGTEGMVAALLIQLLNAVGFLFFAYALRYGKAIIAVPMMSLAPVITVILSLVLYAVVPHAVTITGMVMAFVAIYLLAE